MRINPRKVSIYFIICYFSLLILTSCQSSLNPNDNKNAESEFKAETEVSRLLLKNISTKVYQILVKKRQDRFLSYVQDFPSELLPFDLRNSDYNSIGTAFSLEPGIFLSCAHVFQLHLLPTNEEFFLRDEKGQIYSIEFFTRYSIHRDVAEFNLKNNIILPTIEASSLNPSIGDEVYSVGNALGVGISVRNGVVSSFTPDNDFGEWKSLRFSAAASPGNSGGPLINKEGKVVGIIAAKSQNENLNVSYPITLLKDVPTAKAELKMRLQFSPYQQRQVYTIQGEIKLPKQIHELRSELFQVFTNQVKTKLDVYLSSLQTLFLSDKPSLDNYLRQQEIGNFWQKISKKNNEGWSPYRPEFSKIKDDKGNELLYSPGIENQETTLFYSHFRFQLKNPEDLPKLMENPAPHMGKIFNRVIGPIKFGNVSIDIDQIKSPEETYWYRDQLSRPWRIDVYRFHTYGLAYITACTSVPKGIACHLMQPMQLGLEHYGAIQLAKYELDYWTLSPSGTPEEWNNFLNLPEKWRWTSLSKTKVQFNQKSNELKLSFPPYELEMEVPSIFSQLEIATHLGYDKQSPLGANILGMALYDLYGKSFFYNLPQYVPPQNAEKEEQVFYKQVKNLESEFNGQVIKDKDEKKIILVSSWRGNKLIPLQKNNSTPDSELQKVFCYTDTHHNDEELKKWCMQFLSSIRKK